MAKMPIEIINLLADGTNTLMLAVAEATSIQDEFEFSFLESSLADEMHLYIRSDTHTRTFFDAVLSKKLEWRGYHPFLIAFVSCPIHSEKWKNIFSSRQTENGLAIVTNSNVENQIIPRDKMVAYYLYELAIHSLAFIVPTKPNHKDRRNCIFDFKEVKSDILCSMKQGALCDQCKQWYLDNGNLLSMRQLNAIDTLLGRCAELIEQTEEIKKTSKHRIFIGSSIEGLEIARAVQSELQYDYSVEIWNQNTVFGVGMLSIEALEEAAREYDYAIFVFTPDDLIKSRDVESRVPRDNVIFEAGLFIGTLTRFKAFIIQPRNEKVQLPNDLAGLTTATYDSAAPVIDASIGPACRQIRQAIQNT